MSTSNGRRTAELEGGLSFAGESQGQKRKARIDTHTDLEGFLEKIDLKKATQAELVGLLKSDKVSEETKARIEGELKKRLDPEDQDAVEV